MNDDKIELSLEAARGLLPCLRATVQGYDAEIARLTKQRNETLRSLTELEARVTGKEATLEGKRLRKGEAEKIIFDLLNTLPPSERGISIQEVVKRSGVPYASTHRILNQNKKGHFDNPQGLWQVVGK